MPFRTVRGPIRGGASEIWIHLPFYAASLLLLAGLLLGGIQSYAPTLNFTVEALTIIYIAFIYIAFSMRGAERLVWSPLQLTLAILVLAVPLLQLIPIPYAAWSELPNRGLIVEADKLVGFGRLWRPVTMSVEGTTRALIGLLPPLAIFLTVPGFPQNRRSQFIIIVLAVASLSLVMSAIQFGSSPGAFRFYRGGHDTVPVGIFANRNHQANFMLVCMPLAAAIIRIRMCGSESAQLGTAFVAAVALAVGVLATNSRTGFALLPVAFGGAAWVFARGNPSVAIVSRSWVFKISLAVIAVAFFGVVVVGTAGTRTLLRFGDLGDLRFENWPLVFELAKAHLPLGSGLGTFDSVFRSAENLNLVSEKYFNHAHNDYIEVLLETGVPGALVGLAAIAVLARQFLHTSARTNPLEFAAGVAIVLMLAHSLIDYPLRTYTLSMTFALCAALLLNPGSPRSSTRGQPKSGLKEMDA